MKGFESSLRNRLKSFYKQIKGDNLPNSSLSKAVLQELKEQYGGKCFWCKVEVDNFSFDHFIPRLRGGTTIKENLVLCCKSCNSSKGTKDPVYFAKLIGMTDVETIKQKRKLILEKIGIPEKDYIDQFSVIKTPFIYVKFNPSFNEWIAYIFIDHIPNIIEVFRSIPPRTARFVKWFNNGRPVCAWCCLPEYEDEIDYKLLNWCRDVKIVPLARF